MAATSPPGQRFEPWPNKRVTCLDILDIAGTRFVTTIAWSASSIAGIAEWPVHTGATAGIRIAMAIATDAPELLRRLPQARRPVTPPPVMRLLVTSEEGPLDAPVPRLRPAATCGPGKSWADNAHAERAQRRKSHIAAVAANRSLDRSEDRNTIALAKNTLGKHHGRDDRHNADANQDGTDSPAAA